MNKFFVAGGTLRADIPSYVTRPADTQLLDLALAGEFCYVLTPRQMGKSSLMIRTSHRLQERDVRTAIVDLTRIGSVDAEQWYLGLLTHLKRGLKLETDVITWWQSRFELSVVQRFTDFLRDIVLTECEQKVVIFIDEIDSTLNLDFRDDFFAAIRAMYNARAEDPEFGRLTFVLLGVASPTDLIADPARTPFNIGQAIALQEFTYEDAAVLQQGLEDVYPGKGAEIFDRIYHWTGGHPYLTQKLCLAVVGDRETAWDSGRIDALVDELFLAEEAHSEGNLKFVQDRLLSHPQREGLLHLYRKVLSGKQVPDDGQSVLHNNLKLSGLVKAGNGHLQVRNRIYQQVFNLEWVRENTIIKSSTIAAWSMGVVAVLAVGLLLYSTLVTSVRIPQLRSDFYDANKSHSRLTTLSRMVNLWMPFNPDSENYQVKELFFSLSPGEQAALFSNPGNDAHIPDSHMRHLIQALYITLADVDGTNSSGPVLKAMLTVLEYMKSPPLEHACLRDELAYWVQARAAVDNEAYAGAQNAYQQALELNPHNVAVCYESARVAAEMGDYPAALQALDRVMAQAGVSPEATPTPGATATIPLSATQGVIEPPADAPVLFPSDEPTAPVTFSIPITGTPVVLGPADPPEPLPGISDFRDTGHIRNGVRNLIALYPELITALALEPQSDYANLRESWWSLVPTSIREADGMEMVYVPAGEFQMGSTEEEADAAFNLCEQTYGTGSCDRGWYERELPEHKVVLDAFWLDRTEVSVAQFRRFVLATGYKTVAEQQGWSWYWNGESWDQVEGVNWQNPWGEDIKLGESHPVVHISWDDAMAYCNWAGGALPTEAQWEYAAGGPASLVYPWGDTFDCNLGNFDDETEIDTGVVPGGPNCDGYDRTAPVGSFPGGSSWAGALDMSGNVWEWVADWYGEYPSESQRNPVGPLSGDYRVLRGGSWRLINGANLRCSSRDRSTPTSTYFNGGFRCVVGSSRGNESLSSVH